MNNDILISEAKSLPFVDKIRIVKDGIYIYGKENLGRSGSHRLETFISSKESIGYQRRLLDDFKDEAKNYYKKSYTNMSKFKDFWKNNFNKADIREMVEWAADELDKGKSFEAVLDAVTRKFKVSSGTASVVMENADNTYLS